MIFRTSDDLQNCNVLIQGRISFLNWYYFQCNKFLFCIVNGASNEDCRKFPCRKHPFNNICLSNGLSNEYWILMNYLLWYIYGHFVGIRGLISLFWYSNPTWIIFISNLIHNNITFLKYLYHTLIYSTNYTEIINDTLFHPSPLFREGVPTICDRKSSSRLRNAFRLSGAVSALGGESSLFNYIGD